ncbi:MAG: hypothetical protein KC544_02755 [Gemmatimonadetes bacterium]|nr:hypothetical protein [Gemmatimonadota bacterium]MCA9762031.1 hypothetical protein [Gemmatimonadota bacterium]MCB9518985.1 hypothetical protein [Gemmatimonadales bacterium]HPF62775.1 hypothetical protein [Gemmatimonadales bacterium]HRX19945.1 hypothetical protein [Gemmatimonadales bacterium]
MISGLFGTGTVTNTLRGGLDEASATHRTIAERVARGLGRSAAADFSGALDASMANMDEELTRNMAALADTQLRYEATARLLQKSYSDLRTAIRDRG